MDLTTRKTMIESTNKKLSINQQCLIVGLMKSCYYYKSQDKFSINNLNIMNEIDKIYTDYPFYGYRRLHQELLSRNHNIGKDRVLKYMHIMGIEAVFPQKKTTMPNKEHKIFPYLLKKILIDHPNQVWAIDITYIRMHRGFCYLVAIIDWYSRYLLGWELSNTMEVDFCLEALNNAFKLHGMPEIFNSDQGSQFTSNEFTGELLNKKIKISMNSKGRALDNIIIERFFRSLKCENIYLHDYHTIKDLTEGIRKYINFYNYKRKHSSLNYQTPYEVFNKNIINFINTEKILNNEYDTDNNFNKKGLKFFKKTV